MSIPVKKLKNGKECPSLGLGTWLMGGDINRTETPQDALDIKLIQSSLENGFTHIDTAEIYGAGHAEELIGEAIRTTNRHELFLASKVKKGNHSKDSLPSSLDNSLKRLGTDYLDLYYLHQPTPDTPFEETADALNKSYKAGKIRNIGVCNFSIQNFDTLQSYLDVKIFANQVHYNLAFREPAFAGLLDHSIQNDYFLIAWRPLKLVKRNVENPNIAHNIWDKGAFPTLDKMADKYGVSNVEIALAWVTYHPNITTLVKSSKIDHLMQSVRGVKLVLSEDDYQTLSRDFIPQYDISDTVPLL